MALILERLKFIKAVVCGLVGKGLHTKEGI